MNTVSIVKGRCKRISSSVQKILILPKTEEISPQYQNNFLQIIDKLKILNYEIFYHNKFSQRFIIIDKNLIWLLPENHRNKNDDEISMRLYSKDMRTRLLKYFDIQ